MRATRQRFRALAAVSVAAALLAAGCGSDSGSSSDTTAAAGAETTAAAAATTAAAAGGETTAAAGGDLAALVEAATKEGKVNLIALPDTWANYKGILQSFRDKYPGIENPVATPDASSADELTAVQTLAGQADMPDSIDVGPPFAIQAKTDGVWEPYKVSTWDEIPDALKDPDGNWAAAYYGIIALGTNTTIVKNAPKTIADLKNPEYKGQVFLNDDPRQAGAAFAGVMAASLANGGSLDDIMPGIQFFADLKKSGNFVPGDVTPAMVLSGEVPIVLDWTYNWPGLVPQLDEAGITSEVVVPSDGVYGSYYAQGVVKGSPHPNAAKLWVEHILSDEGALGYLEGGAVPARYAALVAAGKVTDDLKKNLPDPELIKAIEFPTQEQIDKAKQVLTDNWGPMVADA